MFQGFSPRTIDFMWNLRLNNQKPWFEAHKEEYKRDFLGPMKQLGGEVFEKVAAANGEHDFIHKVSRIYKDARRLHGDGPYRDNMWFSIEKPSEIWTATPVFWFELTPESWSYGMGYYQAKSETMAKLRARIDAEPKKFEQLIAPLAKQGEFLLEGPEYVRKKPAPTEKTAMWYNRKSVSLIHKQQNSEELFSPELANKLVAGYQFLMPFYNYFVTLDCDPRPEG